MDDKVPLTQLIFWIIGIGVTLLVFILKHILSELREVNNRLTQYQLEATRSFVSADQVKALEKRMTERIDKK